MISRIIIVGGIMLVGGFAFIGLAFTFFGGELFVARGCAQYVDGKFEWRAHE